MLDKTELDGGKIESMSSGSRYALTGPVSVCACVWVSLSARVLAQAEASAPRASALGIGGAYLFGFALGLLIFALRQAIAVRKAHLAGPKK